jgi:crotonobetainyl-CoA:carnitine CoA-transferase CaiB-like acyl-CoA transferase
MPFGIFPTSDGGVAIAAPGPGHWAALCEAMGRPDLLNDERTRNTYVRRRHQDFVEAEIKAWTLGKTKHEVVAALGGTVPCGPVNTAADIFADPHVRARNMITEFDLPGDNPRVAIVGSPIKYTGTPAGFTRRPPMLGEHTEEVFEEFDVHRERPR